MGIVISSYQDVLEGMVKWQLVVLSGWAVQMREERKDSGKVCPECYCHFCCTSGQLSSFFDYFSSVFSIPDGANLNTDPVTSL